VSLPSHLAVLLAEAQRTAEAGDLQQAARLYHRNVTERPDAAEAWLALEAATRSPRGQRRRDRAAAPGKPALCRGGDPARPVVPRGGGCPALTLSGARPMLAPLFINRGGK
jgi:hypothetical protein